MRDAVREWAGDVKSTNKELSATGLNIFDRTSEVGPTTEVPATASAAALSRRFLPSRFHRLLHCSAVRSPLGKASLATSSQSVPCLPTAAVSRASSASVNFLDRFAGKADLGGSGVCSAAEGGALAPASRSTSNEEKFKSGLSGPREGAAELFRETPSPSRECIMLSVIRKTIPPPDTAEAWLSRPAP